MHVELPLHELFNFPHGQEVIVRNNDHTDINREQQILLSLAGLHLFQEYCAESCHVSHDRLRAYDDEKNPIGLRWTDAKTPQEKEALTRAAASALEGSRTVTDLGIGACALHNLLAQASFVGYLLSWLNLLLRIFSSHGFELVRSRGFTQG